MGGGNGHTGVAGETDRDCGGHLSRHPLGISHAFLTDFLADGGGNTTPANHRTNTQRQCDGHNDPDRRVLNGAQHVSFQFFQQTLIVSAYARQLNHFIGGIRDAQHNTAQLTTLFDA